MSTLAAMQYRVDFLVRGLIAFLWSALTLIPLLVVFGVRKQVAGWSFGEALVVVAWFTLLRAVLEGAVSPSLTAVVEHVRKGTLDFVLLKPADAQFLVSTAKFEPWRVVDVVGAVVVFCYAFATLGRWPSLAQIATGLVFLALAVLILYSIWILVVSAAFWVVKVDNLSYLFGSLFDVGRWPIDVLRGVWRGTLTLVFTFVFPVGADDHLPGAGAARTAGRQDRRAGAGGRRRVRRRRPPRLAARAGDVHVREQLTPAGQMHEPSEGGATQVLVCVEHSSDPRQSGVAPGVHAAPGFGYATQVLAHAQRVGDAWGARRIAGSAHGGPAHAGVRRRVAGVAGVVAGRRKRRRCCCTQRPTPPCAGTSPPRSTTACRRTAATRTRRRSNRSFPPPSRGSCRPAARSTSWGNRSCPPRKAGSAAAPSNRRRPEEAPAGRHMFPGNTAARRPRRSAGRPRRPRTGSTRPANGQAQAALDAVRPRARHREEHQRRAEQGDVLGEVYFLLLSRIWSAQNACMISVTGTRNSTSAPPHRCAETAQQERQPGHQQTAGRRR